MFLKLRMSRIWIQKLAQKAFGQKLRHADILASHPFDVFVETIIFGIFVVSVLSLQSIQWTETIFQFSGVVKKLFQFFFSPTSDATTETDTSVVPEPNKERLGRESNGLQRQTVVQVLHLDKQPTTIFFGCRQATQWFFFSTLFVIAASNPFFWSLLGQDSNPVTPNILSAIVIAN